jgi:hypothetical protein
MTYVTQDYCVFGHEFFGWLNDGRSLKTRSSGDLACLILRRWDWRRHVPPKPRMAFKRITRCYIPEDGILLRPNIFLLLDLRVVCTVHTLNDLVSQMKILSRVLLTTDVVSDSVTGFIDILYTALGTTGNTALLPIYTHYSSPLHTH